LHKALEDAMQVVLSNKATPAIPMAKAQQEAES
jgi:hypothetical protein